MMHTCSTDTPVVLDKVFSSPIYIHRTCSTGQGKGLTSTLTQNRRISEYRCANHADARFRRSTRSQPMTWRAPPCWRQKSAFQISASPFQPSIYSIANHLTCTWVFEHTRIP